VPIADENAGVISDQTSLDKNIPTLTRGILGVFYMV
jgi:hypothetical protein